MAKKILFILVLSFNVYADIPGLKTVCRLYRRLMTLAFPGPPRTLVDFQNHAKAHKNDPSQDDGRVVGYTDVEMGWQFRRGYHNYLKEMTRTRDPNSFALLFVEQEGEKITTEYHVFTSVNGKWKFEVFVEVKRKGQRWADELETVGAPEVLDALPFAPGTLDKWKEHQKKKDRRSPF